MIGTEYRDVLIFRTPEERANAEKRERFRRWDAPARSIVTHPAFGAVCVPHASNFSAVCCAAEAWQCDPLKIIGASVTAAPAGMQLGAVTT